MSETATAEVFEDDIAETTEAGPRMAKKVVGIEKEAHLEVLVDDNPKRPGSAAHTRFQLYLDEKPSTVQEALDAGITIGDLKNDSIKGYIKIDGTEVVEYEVKPKGPRKPKNEDGSDETEEVAQEVASADTEATELF